MPQRASFRLAYFLVVQVAYALGFEHSQSFGRFFKTETALSPLAFRQSFQPN